MINLLGCSLTSWRGNYKDDRPTQFYCYDWQAPSLDTFFPSQMNHSQRKMSVYDPANVLKWLEQFTA